MASRLLPPGIGSDCRDVLPEQAGALPGRERVRGDVDAARPERQQQLLCLRDVKSDDLHSGATIYEAIGAYNFEKHNEIITIVDKSEYQKLMNFINREDPKAFITIYNVSNMQYQPKTRA